VPQVLATGILGFTEGIIEAVVDVGIPKTRPPDYVLILVTLLLNHQVTPHSIVSCLDLRNRRALINAHNKFKECLMYPTVFVVIAFLLLGVALVLKKYL
jgi:hypothetical protein